MPSELLMQVSKKTHQTVFSFRVKVFQVMHLPAAPENSFVLNFEHVASSWMEVCFVSAVDLYHVSFYFGTEMGERCKVLLTLFEMASPETSLMQGPCFTCIYRSRGNNRSNARLHHSVIETPRP